MKRRFTTVGRLVYGLMAVGILFMGAEQLRASEAMIPCDGPEQLGTCPGDYDASTCNSECVLQMRALFGVCEWGCCTCVM